MSTAFQNFLTKWGVTHRLSSAEYPESNGRTEMGVKTAKRIMIMCHTKEVKIMTK